MPRQREPSALMRKSCYSIVEPFSKHGHNMRYFSKGLDSVVLDKKIFEEGIIHVGTSFPAF